MGVDKPFNHHTGVGSVKEVRGDYYDALRVKRATVVPMIVETHGGITAHSLKYVSRLARRAEGAGERDRTAYGLSRTSPHTFYLHHVLQISAAAQIGDAKAIRREITFKKMALMGCASHARAQA